MKIVANKFLLTLLLVSSWTVMLGQDNPCVGTEANPCPPPLQAPPDLELPIDENVFILLSVAILFGIYIIYSNSLKTKNSI